MAPKYKYLFGGDRYASVFNDHAKNIGLSCSRKWDADDWTASDDRVRGGKSQSYLDIESSGSVAKFNGNLDTETLGGAGFASQRTTGDDRSWDLSKYDGIELVIAKADAQRYTFTVKNHLLPRRSDGREQSTVVYEYDFAIDSGAGHSENDDNSTTIFIPWSALKATYRGKPKDDAPKFNKKKIKRFSIMNRSFFGDQKGKFALSIKSIAAVQNDLGYDELVGDVARKVAHYDDLEKASAAVDEKAPLIGLPREADGNSDVRAVL